MRIYRNSNRHAAMSTNAIVLSRLLVTERATLIRWISRIIGNEPTAEDITQALYFRVQTVKDVPPIRNKRSFLFRLASNLALDQLRSMRRHDRLFAAADDVSHMADATPDIEAHLLDREKLRCIAATVDHMPARCRQVFVLVRLDGLSVADTANRLGISHDMVRKHLRHGLQLCQRAIADDETI